MKIQQQTCVLCAGGFMCQLDESKRCPVLVKHCFWGCAWVCFWKKWALDSVDEEIHAGRIIKSTEGKKEQRGGGRAHSHSLARLGSLSPLGPLPGSSWFSGLWAQMGLRRPPAPRVLRPSDLCWMTPLAFLVSSLQMAYCGISSLHNQVNQVL